MRLRVGYVNVYGLTQATWEACLLLLNHQFDYLIVAETWFLNHDVYICHRQFITATTPPQRNLHGRQRGGIYLLGTQHARSQVERVVVTEHSIMFACGKLVIAGVYFPPTTLVIEDLTKVLNAVASATVIVGDINTRFRDPRYQSGEPGPLQRIHAFQALMATTGHTHLKPQVPPLQLTTDHCFARLGYETTLTLLSNAILKIKTDHTYTLSIIIGRQPRPPVTLVEVIHRFRISQLSNPIMRQRLLEEVNRRVSVREDVQTISKVSELHVRLVTLCHQVQEVTIGRVRQVQSSRRGTTMPRENRQTMAESIRLYKQVSQASKENDVIFPTSRAQALGIDAVTENLTVFKKRWLGRGGRQKHLARGDSSGRRWTTEQVVEEIRKQESEKSCGADGIHICFLKAVIGTAIVDRLTDLYNVCWAQGQTPSVWNDSEIYLLSKDVLLQRNVDNLRPISIICLFRKIFERLLLVECHSQAWASVHPAQAGFRRSYSTYTNAAIVHTLLRSRARSTVVFLDFKSAFDVLDHQLLDKKLSQRRCPPAVHSIIRHLMFNKLRSRLLINGQTTEWFPRTCGVLQGSPLSPWLFNLFIDDLLYEVNEGIQGVPICLFYADDGVIITNAQVDIVAKVRVVESWTRCNALQLNPKKCAIITAQRLLPVVQVYGDEIKQVEEYMYLGFPVTREGINFPQHLEQRISAAVGRARWLGVQSDAWGPAHRLRVYKQYLAPMFEYGAPLVAAWMREVDDTHKLFDVSCKGFKHLMEWIANAKGRHMITANLCGLSSLHVRFQELGTAYQLILDQLSHENPLWQILSQAKQATQQKSSFAFHLRHDPLYERFKYVSDLTPTIREALARFIRQESDIHFHIETMKSHLTSLIPRESRQKQGLRRADVTLSAPLAAQGMLLQYRRGVFMWNCTCACNPLIRFRRGHEECTALSDIQTLSRVMQSQKRKIHLSGVSTNARFTNIDFLLNIGQLTIAITMLCKVQDCLRQTYKEEQELNNL